MTGGKRYYDHFGSRETASEGGSENLPGSTPGPIPTQPASEADSNIAQKIDPNCAFEKRRSGGQGGVLDPVLPTQATPTATRRGLGADGLFLV